MPPYIERRRFLDGEPFARPISPPSFSPPYVGERGQSTPLFLLQVLDATPRDYPKVSDGSKALAALAARCLGQLARPPA